MIKPDEVHEGMEVRTQDGRRVGMVTGIGDVHFELEPGIVRIPRRDFLVDYRDVAYIRGRHLYLEPTARWEPEEDDDGSALAPRQGDLEKEPVNIEEGSSASLR